MKIGITLRTINEVEYQESRDALSHEWVEFLKNIDGIPIFIPNNLQDVKLFLEELEIKGLILSGGGNIGDNSDRDKTEKEVIEYGIEQKIPIFGICRGMQVINKFFGGIQKKHVDSSHVAKHHTIEISNQKFNLENNQKIIKVNSFHNNVISKDDIGSQLEIIATSKEGLIEGLMHKELPIVGVMWHPEREPNKFNRFFLKEIFNQN